MTKIKRQQLIREIEKRSHNIEGQGDGIFMVLIRLDEILSAVAATERKKPVRGRLQVR
jgi:hypothetical protein